MPDTIGGSGTKVIAASRAAGVTCPKDTGQLGKDEDCHCCEHWAACAAAIRRAIGWPI